MTPKTKLPMDFFAQLIPRYLLTKRSLTIMVTSAAAFAFLFIIIYKPFNVEHWAKVSQFVFVACVLGVVLLGMSIAAISRVIMCYYAKKHKISYLKYTAWVFVELVLMSIAFTICSTLTGVQLAYSAHPLYREHHGLHVAGSQSPSARDRRRLR